MAQQYDMTLKSILKDVPRRFLKMLTGFEDAKFLDVQFPSIKYRQPDLLMDLPDDSLCHFEIQSFNDGSMDWRMLDYFSVISQQCKRIPKQVLLYVGDEKLTMGKGLKFERLTFGYIVKDIREIECSELLQSDNLSDVQLSILCKTDDVVGTAREILARSSHLGEEARGTYILELFNLSRLRGLSDIIKKEVESMPVTIDLSKDALYLEGTRKGLVEGERKGLAEGIGGMLDIKYGAAGLEIMPSVKTMASIEKMEAFKGLIKRSKTVDELKEFLQG
ncbi:hypothetical protein MBAV_006075 [Candidatus Magnetobacterium bavaricum]|uniref:Transposase (Putative), YhgA-like protein n=1 Tax=Candidatus Magnetobacterium bavaricum TaxID=29290 RepID=A0A0F3GM08_9BACT|nr:hypothetical protein MBAV_006075 [Candidatus Magnetobacterium bavaricum]